MITAEMEFDPEDVSDAFEPLDWLGIDGGNANETLATRDLPEEGER
jgi:hypothetical protein